MILWLEKWKSELNTFAGRARQWVGLVGSVGETVWLFK